MIYIAFSEDWEVTGRTISIFSLESWKDFINWLNGCDPKELYVAESVEEILKLVSQLIYCDLNSAILKER